MRCPAAAGPPKPPPTMCAFICLLHGDQPPVAIRAQRQADCRRCPRASASVGSESGSAPAEHAGSLKDARARVYSQSLPMPFPEAGRAASLFSFKSNEVCSIRSSAKEVFHGRKYRSRTRPDDEEARRNAFTHPLNRAGSVWLQFRIHRRDRRRRRAAGSRATLLALKIIRRKQDSQLG